MAQEMAAVSYINVAACCVEIDTGKYAGLLAHRFNQVNNINTEKEFLLRLN
jgi:hypothetical protein